MVPPVLQPRRDWISRTGSGGVVVAPPEPRLNTIVLMSRPTRFEHFRYLGDKRNQVVYDLDLADSDGQVAAAITELLESEQFAAFGPDTLAEARNRGYHAHRSIRA
jgi:hypothetical protein